LIARLKRTNIDRPAPVSIGDCSLRLVAEDHGKWSNIDPLHVQVSKTDLHFSEPNDPKHTNASIEKS
jgi:hypothetical protein